METIEFFVYYEDEKELYRCIESIEMLVVPENFSMEITSFSEVDNMKEAFDELISKSESTYKFLSGANAVFTNKNLLKDAIALLEENPSVGLVGVLGGFYTDSADTIEWSSGSIYISDGTKNICCKGNSKNNPEILNGVLFAMKEVVPYHQMSAEECFDAAYSRCVRDSGYKLAVLDDYENPYCIYYPQFSKHEHNNIVIGDSLQSDVPSDCMPLVSCIITAYNAQEFLADTIESIRQQTYKNLEIIIIDNASDDETWKVISSYMELDKRIVGVRCDKNRHTCVADNLSYEIAKGKYIAMCGHDDVWIPRKISKQVLLMENNQKIAVCFSGCSIIGDDGNDVSEKEEGLVRVFSSSAKNRSREEWFSLLFFHGNCLCAPSALLRKSCWNKPLYKLGLIQLQDFDLWLNILRDYEIFVMEEELVLYRRFEKRENLSKPNEKKYNAINREAQYIRFRLLKDMSDDEFKHLFAGQLIREDASSESDFACERVLLLKAMGNYNCINMFIEMLDDPELCKNLEERYNFTTMDFYELNGEAMCFDWILLNEIEKYKLIMSEQQNLIQKLIH